MKLDIEQFKRPDFEQRLDEHVGYKPNKWQEEVRKTEARFKVICAGRRSGKSYYVTHDTKDGLVADLVLPQQKVWVVAPNYDLTQRIWDELYTIAVTKFRPVIQRIHNTKGNFKIETALGTTIEAKSADEPEKLVGMGLTKVVIDEAALVKPKAWNQSIRPTLIDHRGKALIISTPKGKNWFWKLWMRGQQAEESEWKSWRFPSFDNDHLDRTELAEITKDMPEFEYRQEILATFEETAEQLFRNVAGCSVGSLHEPEKGHKYQIGVDFGRKSSYSVISVIDESVYPFSLVHHERFRTVDWKITKQRIAAVWEKYNSFRMRVDATSTGGDVLAEDLGNEGIWIDPYVFTETSKRELINKLALYIEDQRIIFPPIKELLDELEVYGREILESGKIRYRPLQEFPDDCIMSLALAVWGLPDKPRERRERKERPILTPLSKITGY